MEITREILTEKINQDSKDTRWILQGGNKTRVRTLIKRYKLSHKEIKFLWRVESLRWDIIRRQQVSDSIKKAIINKTSKVTTVVFKEMLINQEFSPAMIKYLDSETDKEQSPRKVIAWETIPQKMYTHGDFNRFLTHIKYESYLNIASALISIARQVDNTLPIIVKAILDSPRSMDLAVLAKTLFFQDDIIDMIKTSDYIDELLLFKIMENLVSRNNCSLNKKAKFLLEF